MLYGRSLKMNLAYYPELVILLLFLAVETLWFTICTVAKIIDLALHRSAKQPNESIGKLFNLGTFVIIFVFLCLIVNSLLLRTHTMDDTLHTLLYLLGTFIYLIFMIVVFVRTVNEYAAKENTTNKDYLVALIKRMLIYPCLVFIVIMFVCVLLNIALLTISQYIVS